MHVTVSIGVQQPDRVDTNAVAEQIPYGKVTVEVTLGGLNIHDEESDSVSVIAAASVAARLDLPAGKYTLSAK